MIFFFFIRAKSGRISFNFFIIFFFDIACVSCTWLTNIRFNTTIARRTRHLVLLFNVNMVDIFESYFGCRWIKWEVGCSVLDLASCKCVFASVDIGFDLILLLFSNVKPQMLPRVSTGELWGSVRYRLSFYTLTRQCQGNWSTSTVRPFFALPCKPRRGEGRSTNNNDLGSGQSNARNWKLKVRARVQAVKPNLAQAHQRFTFCIGQCLTGFSLASYSNSDWTCWSRCMHVVELSKHKQKWSCSSIGSSRGYGGRWVPIALDTCHHYCTCSSSFCLSHRYCYYYCGFCVCPSSRSGSFFAPPNVIPR